MSQSASSSDLTVRSKLVISVSSAKWSFSKASCHFADFFLLFSCRAADIGARPRLSRLALSQSHKQAPGSRQQLSAASACTHAPESVRVWNIFLSISIFVLWRLKKDPARNTVQLKVFFLTSCIQHILLDHAVQALMGNNEWTPTGLAEELLLDLSRAVLACFDGHRDLLSCL